MRNAQAMFALLSSQMQRQRAQSQMTLGQMIAALECMPNDAEVANLGKAHSYRGYYEDLAFSRGAGTRNVSELLDECKALMGRVLMGYKGGYYMMGELTPVWIADYGYCGRKLIALREGGVVVTAEDDFDA